MRTPQTRILVFVAVLATSSVHVQSVAAGSVPTGVPAATKNPVDTTLDLRKRTPDSTVLAKAVARARKSGTAKIIVVPRADFRPSSNKSKSRLKPGADQLARLKRTFSRRVVHSASTHLVIDATLRDLDAVRRSKDVGLVQLDDNLVVLDANSNQVIGVDKAEDFGHSGAGWSVGVIDSGVDGSADAIAGRVIAGYCSSVYRKACRGKSSDTGIRASEPCTWRECDHGTHVASIAAGSLGVASGATIVSGKVAEYVKDGGNRVTFPTSDVVNIIGQMLAAHTNGRYRLASINLSIGSTTAYTDMRGCKRANEIYEFFFALAVSINVPVVVASGNGGSAAGVSAPACVDHAIAVGAVNNLGMVADFSNGGPEVDLLAPGVDVWGAVPDKTGDYKSGTSMAAPHVAGGFALLRQVDEGATVDELLASMQAHSHLVRDVRAGGHSVPVPDLGAILAQDHSFEGMSPHLSFDGDVVTGAAAVGSYFDLWPAGAQVTDSGRSETWLYWTNTSEFPTLSTTVHDGTYIDPEFVSGTLIGVTPPCAGSRDTRYVFRARLTQAVHPGYRILVENYSYRLPWSNAEEAWTVTVVTRNGAGAPVAASGRLSESAPIASDPSGYRSGSVSDGVKCSESSNSTTARLGGVTLDGGTGTLFAGVTGGSMIGTDTETVTADGATVATGTNLMQGPAGEVFTRNVTLGGPALWKLRIDADDSRPDQHVLVFAALG